MTMDFSSLLGKTTKVSSLLEEIQAAAEVEALRRLEQQVNSQDSGS